MSDQNNSPTTLTALRYAAVNAAWPVKHAELPKLTDHEAVAAARRLYRLGCSLYDLSRTVRGKARMTTGNRYTYVRRDRFVVNAERGWHDLVHDISHDVHSYCRPNERAHLDGHAWVERQLIEHVVNSGWLDGKLKRPVRPKPAPRNVKAENYKRVCQRLQKWESRERRARNAIRKLRQSRRYYERQGISASPP